MTVHGKVFPIYIFPIRVCNSLSTIRSPCPRYGKFQIICRQTVRLCFSLAFRLRHRNFFCKLPKVQEVTFREQSPWAQPHTLLQALIELNLRLRHSRLSLRRPSILYLFSARFSKSSCCLFCFMNGQKSMSIPRMAYISGCEQFSSYMHNTHLWLWRGFHQIYARGRIVAPVSRVVALLSVPDYPRFVVCLLQQQNNKDASNNRHIFVQIFYAPWTILTYQSMLEKIAFSRQHVWDKQQMNDVLLCHIQSWDNNMPCTHVWVYCTQVKI